jgi:hypothetical protein
VDLLEAKELLRLELDKLDPRPTEFDGTALLGDGHQQGEGKLVRCAMNGRCTLVGDVVEAIYAVGLHQLVEDEVRIGYIAPAPVEHIRGDDSIAPPAHAMEGILLSHAGQQVDGMLAGDADQVGGKAGVEQVYTLPLASEIDGLLQMLIWEDLSNLTKHSQGYGTCRWWTEYPSLDFGCQVDHPSSPRNTCY